MPTSAPSGGGRDHAVRARPLRNLRVRKAQGVEAIGVAVGRSSRYAGCRSSSPIIPRFALSPSAGFRILHGGECKMQIPEGFAAAAEVRSIIKFLWNKCLYLRSSDAA